MAIGPSIRRRVEPVALADVGGVAMGRRDALGLAARLTLGLGNWQLKIKAAPKATGRKKKNNNKQTKERKQKRGRADHVGAAARRWNGIFRAT